MTNDFNSAATRIDFSAIFGNAAGSSYVMQDMSGKGLVTGLADQGLKNVEASATPAQSRPSVTGGFAPK